MKYRIWIDVDSVVYNLTSIWYKLHNEDYPDHILTEDQVMEWDTQKACDAVGCNARVYNYFDDPRVWKDGVAIEGSQETIYQWHKEGLADIGFLTTASNMLSIPYKIEWLKMHFSFIPDIIVIYRQHLKHLVRGDILIDDAIHNIKDFEGIGILYDQPWNKGNKEYLRAAGKTDIEKWNNVNILTRMALILRSEGFNRKQTIEALRRHMVKDK